MPRFLTVGMSGDDVAAVQAKLKELGDYRGDVDGFYGPKTQRAVLAYQRKRGLLQDGIVGKMTFAALGIKVIEPSEPEPAPEPKPEPEPAPKPEPAPEAEPPTKPPEKKPKEEPEREPPAAAPAGNIDKLSTRGLIVLFVLFVILLAVALLLVFAAPPNRPSYIVLSIVCGLLVAVLTYGILGSKAVMKTKRFAFSGSAAIVIFLVMFFGNFSDHNGPPKTVTVAGTVYLDGKTMKRGTISLIGVNISDRKKKIEEERLGGFSFADVPIQQEPYEFEVAPEGCEAEPITDTDTNNPTQKLKLYLVKGAFTCKDTDTGPDVDSDSDSDGDSDTESDSDSDGDSDSDSDTVPPRCDAPCPPPVAGAVKSQLGGAFSRPAGCEQRSVTLNVRVNRQGAVTALTAGGGGCLAQWVRSKQGLVVGKAIGNARCCKSSFRWQP